MKSMFYYVLLALFCVFAVTDCEAASRRRMRRLAFGSPAASLFNRAYPRAGTNVTAKWTWVTTYTTNESQQVTIISHGVSTNRVTKDVCFKWNDGDVPFALRETFLSLSEEDKGNALAYTQEYWTNKPSDGSAPVKKEDKTTDVNLTKEIKQTELRW